MKAPGFGAALCFAIARTQFEPGPLNEAELLLPTLRAAEPPTACPCCTFPALCVTPMATGLGTVSEAATREPVAALVGGPLRCASFGARGVALLWACASALFLVLRSSRW
jgi:hypothetical protein